MTNKEHNSVAGAMSVMTTLFFMWGFLTCMNDILIPYLKRIFELSHFEAMLVQFAFFGAYFIGSLIYFFVSVRLGDPLNRIGYKNGVIVGLVLAAIGTALFYPAATLVSYPFFLSALFVLGLGFTMLQITANPFVAMLGSPETASGRLNMSQGFCSLGSTIAPIIGSYLVFTYFTGSGADAVKTPYLIFSLMFIGLAIFIRTSRIPTHFGVVDETEKHANVAGALKYPHLLLGALGVFMYVGAEVGVGSMMISFLGLPEIAGMKPAEAGGYVALYWAGLMIGRFAGAISLSNINARKKLLLMIGIPVIAFVILLALKGSSIALIYAIFLILNAGMFALGRASSKRTLTIFACCAAALIVVGMLFSGSVSMWAIVAIGLFNSIMWSNIFTLAIDGLGEYTSQASSLLIMAILGGALMPPVMGLLADSIGVHYSFICPLVSYIYIAYYGAKGCTYNKALKNEK
ncbi:MAG: sugar MFS transporter [Candidatus Kapabacteria bacterium]|nr:sugar MFS transporter [Candidatus Kapabacteria bacterium]